MLRREVEKRLESWRDSPSAAEKADAILKDLLPRATAMFLEGAAIKALGSLGKSAAITVQAMGPCGCKPCGGCGRTSPPDTNCKGCGHYNYA